MDNDIQLGRNVGYLVDQLNVCSRAELANAVGVSVTNIGQLIRGENKGLRPINLVKAAKKLKVNVETLVCDDIQEMSIDHNTLIAGRLMHSYDRMGVSESGFAADDRNVIDKASRIWSDLIRSNSKEAVRIARAIIGLTAS